jgi:hypothetical protein
MCGRVIQSSGPLRLAIVDGLEVSDSRMRKVLPTGFAPDGLPVGVQIVGPWLEDPTPLKLAKLNEREFGSFVPPKMFDD